MADHGSHGRHDRFAIAAAIGGGPAPATIGSCPACGALYADLSVLRDVIRRAWTPVLVRDLRLSPADGARLRPRGWHAVLAAIGSTRDVISRPLAIGFTTLGLVGVLTSAPILPLGSAAAPPSQADSGVTVAEAPEPPMASAAASSAPGVALPSTSPARDPASAPPTDATQVPPPTSRTSLPDRSSGTFLLSIGFLTLGLGLFGVRRSARRSAVR